MQTGSYKHTGWPCSVWHLVGHQVAATIASWFHHWAPLFSGYNCWVQLLKPMWVSGTPEKSIDPLTTCLNHLKAICKQNALEKSSVVTAPSPPWPLVSDSKLHSLMCIPPPPLSQPLSVLVISLGTVPQPFQACHLPARKEWSSTLTPRSSKPDPFSLGLNK